MRFQRVMWIFLSVLLCVSVAHGGEKGTAETVEHLLQMVRESDAAFIRNGKEHSAKDAAKHMKKKYEHFLKKKEIKTAEDFIRLAGTKSLLSGREYALKLADGREIKTAEWLRARLAEYRAEN